MNEYLDMFLTFARVGVMTFGGGAAMLPILEREIVDNKGWATEEELVDYFAIGQCTPGIIAVNTATFIGQKKRGALGGIVATLGIVFPSVVIISILAGLITNFAHLAWVRNAFAGIQVSSACLSSTPCSSCSKNRSSTSAPLLYSHWCCWAACSSTSRLSGSYSSRLSQASCLRISKEGLRNECISPSVL